MFAVFGTLDLAVFSSFPELVQRLSGLHVEA